MRLTILMITAALAMIASECAFGKIIYIRVDRISQNPFPLAVLPTAGSDPLNTNLDIDILLNRDLEFTDYFRIIPKEAYLVEVADADMEPTAVKFSSWLGIDALALIKTSVSVAGNRITLRGALFDTLREKRLLLFDESDSRPNLAALVDRFTDAVIGELTGEPGIFSSRVAYIYKEKGKHSIRTVSIFGKDEETIYTSSDFMLAPEWSFDGKSLLFVKDTVENAQVFKIGLNDRRLSRLTDLEGTVISPAVCRAGGKMAVSVNKGTESEIDLIDSNGKKTRILAASTGLNLSPSFSPDCSQIVFSSGRSGRLHVFVESTSDMVAARRTYQGDLNDNPNWSPRGNKILFSGMDRDGQFDIFSMSPEGEDLTRLTYDSRNNESPSWSPDGRHIVFSSNRTGRYQLWIMKADGTNQRLLISDPFGQAITPTWSPRLR